MDARARSLASALRGLFYAGPSPLLVLVFARSLDGRRLAPSRAVWSIASALFHLPSRRGSEGLRRPPRTRRSPGEARLGWPADPWCVCCTEEAAGAAGVARAGAHLPVPACAKVGSRLAGVSTCFSRAAPPACLARSAPRDDPARLEDLREMLSREKAKEPTPERKELVEELERLVAELSRDKVDKKDAMAELARSMERLSDSQEKQLEEMKKLLEALRCGDKTAQAVAEQIDKGDLSQSMSKLEQMEEDLQKKLQELEKKAGDPAEKKELEKQLANLKEIKAKLAKLSQIEGDFGDLGEALDFLEDFEGKLGDVKDLLKNVKLVKLDCK
jgi:hypothetical protein